MELGRFRRRDSYEGRLGEPITLHKYLYGNGNPANFVDPSGLFSIAEAQAAASIANTLNNLQLSNGLQLAEHILSTQSQGLPISDEYEILLSHGGLDFNEQILDCLEKYSSRDAVIRFFIYGGALPIPKRLINVPIIGSSSRLTNPLSLLGFAFRGLRLPFRVFGTPNTFRALGRANAILARGLLVYDTIFLSTCSFRDF
ncbi:MAG: hypothetical protein SAL07_08290 [Oscillatoria sp. PMC 1051.18]|nr:hypothetical protein [Oscillatoria sp. PMC 1050.18]MEC5029897.1 hypothetical protein [Oscillatoria sp. PMC 1051.18]